MKRANPKDVAQRVAKEVVESNGHIEVSVGEIVAMRDGMIALMQKPLPVRSSFRLAQLGNTLNPHLQAFQTAKDKLIREIGEAVDGTSEYRVKEENMVQFREQIDVLSAEMVDVPSFKILLPATIEIEAQYLMALERFLEVAE